MTIVLLGVSLCGSVSGCGFLERVTSTPSITELPAHPDEITATAPSSTSATAMATGGDNAADDSVAGQTSDGSTEPSATVTRKGPEPGPLQAVERLVVVESMGLGLAAPTLFTEIDPEDYSAGTAALDQLSRQMGLSPEQVRTALLDQVDRMVIGEGDDGGPASIIVVRTPLETLPSASLLRRDLGSLPGGAVSKVSRTDTPAGTAVRAVYRIGSAGDYHYGEALYLEADDAVVSVTMTARTPAEARRLTDRVVKTVRIID